MCTPFCIKASLITRHGFGSEHTLQDQREYMYRISFWNSCVQNKKTEGLQSMIVSKSLLPPNQLRIEEI